MGKKKFEGDPPLLSGITFIVVCVLLNKLLKNLISWKFVNVSIHISDLGFV